MLDVKVSEAVMGWPKNLLSASLPYSTSWATMRLLVDRMRKLGWAPSMALHEQKWDEWTVTLVKGQQSFSATAAELPHAFSLAALAAIEGERK